MNIKLKPLIWTNDKPRFDGKINRTSANDDVWVHDKIRIYNSYCVSRGALPETDDELYIYIQFGNNTIKEEVSSFEKGKIICEHYRQEYWKKLMAEINKMFVK